MINHFKIMFNYFNKIQYYLHGINFQKIMKERSNLIWTIKKKKNKSLILISFFIKYFKRKFKIF